MLRHQRCFLDHFHPEICHGVFGFSVASIYNARYRASSHHTVMYTPSANGPVGHGSTPHIDFNALLGTIYVGVVIAAMYVVVCDPFTSFY